ncbi:tetratricopeptide repeat protein [uncultured Aquimarina sp.]|uniref:tetratricopeptide repeat-containing sensor histidine kinase n=1 Tax=uncultured Aquimarina sp. TaxID=575652 RepID=UPI0026181CD6|nr:tetratricopeptide repeat protein [uncultured Aquimarina sp.]
MLIARYVFFLFIVSVNAQSLEPLPDKYKSESYDLKNDISNVEELKKLKPYYQLGVRYIKKDLNLSLHYFRLFIEESKNYESEELFADSYLRIGAILYAKGELQSSLKHYDSSEYYGKKTKDTISLIATKNDRALLYKNTGHLRKAAKDYFDILKYINNQEKYRFEAIFVYNNLGILYQNLDEPKKSIVYLVKALEISKKIKNQELVLKSLLNLGNAEADLENYDNAFNYLNEVLIIADSLNNRNLLRMANNNVAYYLYLDKKYKESILYAKKALEYRAGDIRSLGSDTYHTLGMAYMELGNYNLSESYLLKALGISEKHKLKSIFLECKFGLYQLKQKMSDYKSALKLYEEYVVIKDSFYGGMVKKEIKNMESNLILEEKEQELQNLSLEKKINEDLFSKKIRTILQILGLMIFASIILIRFYFLKNKATIAENQKKLTESKMQLLRSQMNPHFIFNTIGGIQNFILKSEKYKAYDYLTMFSESIRSIFENSESPFILFSKEIKLIRGYVNLEIIRFRNKIEYIEDIDKNLLEEDEMVAAMMLQPIVENAIIHGLSNKKGSGYIKFKVIKEKEYLTCIVQDNGIGIKAAQQIKKNRPENHLSVATINTNERMKILKKMGYQRSQVTYQDLYNPEGKPQGTKVTVLLPIKK